jgi:hypothetical protein
MLEAFPTSKISVYFYETTRCYAQKAVICTGLIKREKTEEKRQANMLTSKPCYPLIYVNGIPYFSEANLIIPGNYTAFVTQEF